MLIFGGKDNNNCFISSTADINWNLHPISCNFTFSPKEKDNFKWNVDVTPVFGWWNLNSRKKIYLIASKKKKNI